MKGKRRGLAWYFGMIFGDPLVLADDNAPGAAPGGPWWMYLIMWVVIGLLLAAIPAIFLVASLTSATG